MSMVWLVVMFAILAGAIVLQILFSRMKSGWFGLILPTLTFLYALLMVFSIAPLNMTGWQLFGLIATTFLLGNIPTIILLGIYFGCRQQKKKRAQIEKMNIQDLS